MSSSYDEGPFRHGSSRAALLDPPQGDVHVVGEDLFLTEKQEERMLATAEVESHDDESVVKTIRYFECTAVP